jgi:hypothetical protein
MTVQNMPIRSSLLHLDYDFVGDEEDKHFLILEIFPLAKALIVDRLFIPAALEMDRFVELNTRKEHNGNSLAIALTPVRWIAQIINKLVMPLLGRSILTGRIGRVFSKELEESTSDHQKMRVLSHLPSLGLCGMPWNERGLVAGAIYEAHRALDPTNAELADPIFGEKFALNHPTHEIVRKAVADRIAAHLN